MKEKVLITGASGFVGYHLVEAALRQGYEVYAAVRPTSDVRHLEAFSLHYTTLDFGNPEALKKELEAKQYDYIIHGAGITRAKTQEDYNTVNAVYTRNLAAAVAGAAIPLKKFIFLSSLAAVGPTYYADTNPISAASVARPVTSYGKSKLLAEQYLDDIDVPRITLRPTAVYGPREKDIFIMFKTLKRGLEPYIGQKGQVLSFIYAEDLAHAVIRALQSETAGRTYNISDGGRYERYELASLTKRILGAKTFRFHVPMGVVRLIASSMEAIYANSRNTPVLNREKLNELAAENWYCSIEDARRDLGFEPEYNLEAGLTRTLEWYKKNNWL